MKEARPTDDIKVLERCTRFRRPPWWAFWRGPQSDHAWDRLLGTEGVQVCKHCGLRRTRLWAFPETWEYDARFKGKEV